MLSIKVFDTNPRMDRRLEIRIIHKFDPFFVKSEKFSCLGNVNPLAPAFIYHCSLSFIETFFLILTEINELKLPYMRLFQLVGRIRNRV